MKNHSTKNFIVPRKGARRWRFTFREGELLIQTSAEEDSDGGIFFPMPHQEDFDEITKILIEKVGRDACAEGTYSIRPGRPAKLSWRIVSPTH
jgi:hypothetical protein